MNLKVGSRWWNRVVNFLGRSKESCSSSGPVCMASWCILPLWPECQLIHNYRDNCGAAGLLAWRDEEDEATGQQPQYVLRRWSSSSRLLADDWWRREEPEAQVKRETNSRASSCVLSVARRYVEEEPSWSGLEAPMALCFFHLTSCCTALLFPWSLCGRSWGTHPQVSELWSYCTASWRGRSASNDRIILAVLPTRFI
jgi:hypothetical protein